MENKLTISRKKFLRICSTLIAGSSIIGISGIVLRKRYIRQSKTEPCQSYPAGISDAEKACDKCNVSNCPLRKGITL